MNTKHALFEVFCEQAAQESDDLQCHFEAWRSDMNNTSALASLNQSFLNLKGDGRMVGADVIADYALSIENILVQIINGSLQATTEVVEFLDEAVPSASGFVEAYTQGRMPVATIKNLCERAFRFSAAFINNSGPGAARDLPFSGFQMQAKSHLETIDGFLFDLDQNHINHGLIDAVSQLRTCCSIANADEMAAVAGDMERYLGELHKSGETCSMDVMHLISEFHLTMQQLLAIGRRAGGNIPNWNRLVDDAQKEIKH